MRVSIPVHVYDVSSQGCQKQLAAGENRHVFGQYRPATLLGISLQIEFLNKISLDWPHTLTTPPSTLKLSDNPGSSFWGGKTPDQH